MQYNSFARQRPGQTLVALKHPNSAEFLWLKMV